MNKLCHFVHKFGKVITYRQLSICQEIYNGTFIYTAKKLLLLQIVTKKSFPYLKLETFIKFAITFVSVRFCSPF